MTSLTPLNHLDIIQKHSTLDENQFTLKEVDLGVPSNEAHVVDELIDSFKLTGYFLLALLTLQPNHFSRIVIRNKERDDSSFVT